MSLLIALTFMLSQLFYIIFHRLFLEIHLSVLVYVHLFSKSSSQRALQV